MRITDAMVAKLANPDIIRAYLNKLGDQEYALTKQIIAAAKSGKDAVGLAGKHEGIVAAIEWLTERANSGKES